MSGSFDVSHTSFQGFGDLPLPQPRVWEVVCTGAVSADPGPPHCSRSCSPHAETSAWWRGKAAGGQSGGRWRPARVRVLKCSFESLCRRPGPGGRGGVVIIKQHLHRDFVYKALSQGREARGWPAESGLGGRGPCSARPPARPGRPARDCVPGEQSAIHSEISDSPGFLLPALV